jgi:hypothetical protein
MEVNCRRGNLPTSAQIELIQPRKGAQRTLKILIVLSVFSVFSSVAQSFNNVTILVYFISFYYKFGATLNLRQKLNCH